MERKIVSYMVITKITKIGLTTEVNEYIIKQWQPIGGVAVSKMEFTEQYSQALVKYKE